MDQYLLLKYCGRHHPLLPLSGPNTSLTIKIQKKIARVLTCFGFKLHAKEGLNNLIFSIGFQLLKI